MSKPHCPACGATLTPAQVGALLSATRTTAAMKRAGRKPALAPCRYCGVEMGTVERRKHEPRCSQK